MTLACSPHSLVQGALEFAGLAIIVDVTQVDDNVRLQVTHGLAEEVDGLWVM